MSYWATEEFSTHSGISHHMSNGDGPVHVTQVKFPHNIVAVNEAWCDLTGFGPAEVLKAPLTPKILQGEKTNLKDAKAFTDALETKSDAEVELTNYTKNGNMFKHKLKGQRLQCAKTGNAVYFVSSTGTPLDGAMLVKEPWRDEMSDINNKDFLRSAYG